MELLNHISNSRKSVPKANQLLMEYGVSAAKNPREMANKLRVLASTTQDKEKFLSKLVKIHPCRDIIIADYENSKKQPVMTLSAVGDEVVVEKKEVIEKKDNQIEKALVYSGLIILAIVVVNKVL